MGKFIDAAIDVHRQLGPGFWNRSTRMRWRSPEGNEDWNSL